MIKIWHKISILAELKSSKNWRGWLHKLITSMIFSRLEGSNPTWVLKIYFNDFCINSLFCCSDLFLLKKNLKTPHNIHKRIKCTFQENLLKLSLYFNHDCWDLNVEYYHNMSTYWTISCTFLFFMRLEWVDGKENFIHI